jgi:signal peptidase
MMTVRSALALGALLLVMAAAGCAAAGWQLGYRLYAVQTGSMTPTYRPGDLVITAPVAEELVAGDVVTFASPGGHGLTTHRLVAVRPDGGLVTKGDANETPDVAVLDRAAVVGRAVAGVPHGGYVLVFFQQPSGSGSVMTTMLSLTLLWQVFFPGTGAAVPPGRHRPAAAPV